MKFYLGTHMPHWLQRTTVPLFVSFTRLRGLKKLPRAICSWALDSGAFSEIAEHGHFVSTAREYVTAALLYHAEIGGCEWMAIRDWMCEVPMLKKTGLSIREHQRLTIDSYFELIDLAPELPWVPVVQGYEYGDYRRHLDDYANRGVDLRLLPRVGVGSVCRRQNTDEIARIVTMLAMHGLKVHGFGVKVEGLEKYAEHLVSADSMAWSYSARYQEPLKGHTGHINCANCRTYAELWYRLQVWPVLHNLPRVSFAPPRRQLRRRKVNVELLNPEQVASAKDERPIEVLDVVA